MEELGQKVNLSLSREFVDCSVFIRRYPILYKYIN